MYLTKDEINQIQFLKRKSTFERFDMMLQMIESQINLIKAGILFKNPSFSKEKLEICLKNRMKKIYSLKH